MQARVLLLVSLLSVVAVSGCTVPSQLCVIPGLCGGGKSEMANDVVVIKSVQALPAKVSPGQQVKLQVYVENIGNREVKDVEVSLYDHCWMFSKIKVECPDGSKNRGEIPDPDDGKGVRCENIKLLPHQTKSVSWTLTSDSTIALKSQCELKMYAKYHYSTESRTSVTFLNYKEYQKMLDEGKFRPVKSYITEGYGPIKPYLTVEDEQPIPVKREAGGTFTLGFQIKNKGGGFLSEENIKVDNVDVSGNALGGKYNIAKKVDGGTSISSNKDDNVFMSLKDCLKEKAKDGFTLIGKESPKVICQIPLPDNINLPKQSTVYVNTKVEYDYEFRKSVKVTVEPKT